VKTTSVLTLAQAIEIKEERSKCGLNNQIPDLSNNAVSDEGFNMRNC
jgi:hypothetical protein